MSAASILTIISIVNGLVSIAKDSPAVVAHAKALLDLVQPHIQEAGVEAETAFVSAEQKLAMETP